jgi:hypothetical protein
MLNIYGNEEICSGTDYMTMNNLANQKLIQICTKQLRYCEMSVHKLEEKLRIKISAVRYY